MVAEQISREKLIAIVRGVSERELLPFAEAVYAGGVRLLELTYDAASPETDAQNAKNIAILVRAFAGRMTIGAGTVLTAEQVDRTADAGGQFLISPDTNPAVIARTKELGLVSVPGALTPTEIQTAFRAGADFVKLFPAGSLGCGYIRAVSAPLPHIPLLAVGGVTLGNIPAFLAAGVRGFGIGTALANRKWIAEGRFDLITDAARQFTEAVRI